MARLIPEQHDPASSVIVTETAYASCT